MSYLLTIESVKGKRAIIVLEGVEAVECLGSEWFGNAILDFAKSFETVIDEDDRIEFGYFDHECKYCYEPTYNGRCENKGTDYARNYAPCSCKTARKASFAQRFRWRYWDCKGVLAK